MPRLSTTVRNRRVEIDVPDDWPDGTTVDVLTRPTAADEPMRPEEIARLIAYMDSNEPVEWTEKERAAWDADRAAKKRLELSNFDFQPEELSIR